METLFHSSTARLHGHHCLDLRCQNICETAARTYTKQTGSLTHPMRCSSRMIRDVSGGGAVAVTNGEVCSCFFPRGDLWGCPGCQCLCQQRSGFVLGSRAEKRKVRGRRTVGLKVVAMANQHQDLYETLGISPTASDRDIKQAYRRLALKFHPDVNKEPDAQERFLWIKNAYQTLSDPSSRTRYDAVRRRGDENWSPFGGWGSSGAKSREDEEFYGLGEFFRDLEKDLNKRQQEMAEGKGKSLWEELAELGEEFVEFLEKELTIPSPGEAQNSWGAASASGSESEQRDRGKTSAERVVAINGDMVTVKYQCMTEDGKLLYASEEPISFEVGAGDVMGNPLFKERGSEWQEDLVFEVPRNHEEIIRLEKQASASGDGLLMQGSVVELSNGQPAVILQIEDGLVKIDANNPLADLLLRFEVEVVSIERSPDQLGEIADAELHTVHK